MEGITSNAMSRAYFMLVTGRLGRRGAFHMLKEYRRAIAEEKLGEIGRDKGRSLGEVCTACRRDEVNVVIEPDGNTRDSGLARSLAHRYL